MSRIILVTNPADDDATKYLDAWSGLITETVKKQKDILIFELKNKQANKQQLTQIILKEKPQLIVFNGHGNNSSIMGFKNKVLIRCDYNEHLLKEKIVHSMACNSGKELGQKCIRIGTLSYIGYYEEYKLTYLNKQTKQERLDDPIATLFLRPAFEVILALLMGHTAGEAYKKSQTMYRKNLRMLLASPSREYNTKVASRLFHNLKYQVCLGDKGAIF